jgi:hypothetical protein
VVESAFLRSLSHTTHSCGEGATRSARIELPVGMPKQPRRADWRPLADLQGGLITRRQLNDLGLDRFFVRNQVMAGRWVERTSTVIGTTTGELAREATMWLGVLHAGPTAIIGGLTAAEVLGLRNWHRGEITVLVPDELDFDDSEVPGVRFVRTRRDLRAMRLPRPGLPVCRIEPAVLLWAAYQPSRRSAQGVVAAVVQQKLSTPDRLADWVRLMRPLRWAAVFRRTLADIQGGAQSLAEIDIRRMCRATGIVAPTRQRRRVDSTGRVRFTDCEWARRERFATTTNSWAAISWLSESRVVHPSVRSNARSATRLHQAAYLG